MPSSKPLKRKRASKDLAPEPRSQASCSASEIIEKNRKIRDKEMNQKRIESFSALAPTKSNPTTELEYTSPFELLIAVFTFRAQTTDVSVNKATKLYPVANTQKKILALGRRKD